MTDYQQWTCDVLVIGAGPAGCTAARAAARKGVSVLLLERRDRVGLPVRCAEYVPLPIGRYVDLKRPGLLVQPIRSMATHIPGQSVTETIIPGVMINRDQLDQALADLAVKDGACLKTGIQAFSRTDDHVVARKKKEILSISSRVIIGADGPSSQVGRWMGSRHQDYLMAAQYRVSLIGPLDQTKIYFRPYLKGGYGWLFPKGDLGNLGIGLDPSLKKGLLPLLNQFRLELVEEGLIKGDIKGQGGGLVPVGGLTGVVKENMMLAGDAAGTCHPITGAGVGNALISGEMAGEAAAEAILKGDLRCLTDYEQDLTRLLGHSLSHGAKKRKTLTAQWDRPDFSETLRHHWIAFREYYRS
jgi:geranylgeranyl reductase family protein